MESKQGKLRFKKEFVSVLDVNATYLLSTENKISCVKESSFVYDSMSCAEKIIYNSGTD